MKENRKNPAPSETPDARTQHPFEPHPVQQPRQEAEESPERTETDEERAEEEQQRKEARTERD